MSCRDFVRACCSHRRLWAGFRCTHSAGLSQGRPRPVFSGYVSATRLLENHWMVAAEDFDAMCKILRIDQHG